MTVTLPRSRSRMIGVIYLLYFLIAMAAEGIAGRGFVTFGIAANVVAFLCYIILTLLFYGLFRPVNRQLSLLAALFSLLGCADGILGLFHVAPDQMSPLWFFGPYCMLIGYLVFRSTFLPRSLGVLMALAGLGWLIYLSPPLSIHLALYIEGLGILAEGLLMLWLLIFGVNETRWQEEANGRGQA
jgi:uncharacterized protein DUF4386